MWSRNPTPVERAPAPPAVERQGDQRTSVSPVTRCIVCRASSLVGIPRALAPPSTPRAPQSPPRARSVLQRPRVCGLRSPDPHLAAILRLGNAGQRAWRRTVRRRLSAARGWSPPHSRRRPLHCRHRRTTQPALSRPPPRRDSPISSPISCRCSGANAFARAIASRGPETCRTAKARIPDARAFENERTAVPQRAHRRCSPAGDAAATRPPGTWCWPWASMSSAAIRRPSSGETPASRGGRGFARPGEPVDADGAERWRLAPAPRGFPGRR